MVSGLSLKMPEGFSNYFNGCTAGRNIPEQGSDLPFPKGSFKIIKDQLKPAVFLAMEPPLLFFYPAIELDFQYLHSNGGQVPVITRFLKELDGPLTAN